MDLQPRNKTTVSEDRSWLADANGIHTHKATLDYSAFTAADHYPDGHIPSGMGLRKLASGLYGPADAVDGDDDPIGTPAGVLFNTQSTAGAADVHVAVMDAGNILSARLPANNGWDASMAAALPRIADYS